LRIKIPRFALYFCSSATAPSDSQFPSFQNLQLSNLPTFKHALDHPRNENPTTAILLLPANYKGFFAQPLSLHIITNARWVHFSYTPALFSLFAQRAFHNSLAIKGFQNLSKIAGCHPLLCPRS
jgi:hypothetical protein